MAREILHKEQSPHEIKPNNESVYVCRCGLSKNQPFCDGSHKKTKDEEAGKIYLYKEDGTREEKDETRNNA